MRVKMSKPPPPAPAASAKGPCPAAINIVGRPGTGSLPSTIAAPDHPPKRGRKRKERIDESKNVQTTPTRTYCKCSRPLPYRNPNCKMPRHWKFTQHHRTTPTFQSISGHLPKRGRKERKIDESKNVQTTPTRTYCKRSSPLPYYQPK